MPGICDHSGGYTPTELLPLKVVQSRMPYASSHQDGEGGKSKRIGIIIIECMGGFRKYKMYDIVKSFQHFLL